jgi:TrmH family RNA methyltransferase
MNAKRRRRASKPATQLANPTRPLVFAPPRVTSKSGVLSSPGALPGRSSAPSTVDSHAESPIDTTLARIRALNQRTVRNRQQCFWVEGIRNFVHACQAGLSIDTILHSRVLLKSSLVRSLIQQQVAAGVRCVRVTPEQFRRISTAEHASGIGAIVRQHWTPLASANPRAGLGWLIVERIRSPGNLGTILRTAEACGAGGAIFVTPECDPFGCDPFDAAVLRGSMGGLLHLKLVRATHEEVACWARQHDVQLVGLSPAAERLWTELPHGRPIALVIGEERAGLSHHQQLLCHTTVRLPMTGSADSLNVAIATGVVLYELVRRNE